MHSVVSPGTDLTLGLRAGKTGCVAASPSSPGINLLAVGADRWSALLPLLVAGVVFGYYLICAPQEASFLADSNFYLAGARSLAETGEYRLISHRGAPAIGLYPPLHSAFLGLIWRSQASFAENLRHLTLAVSLVAAALSACVCLVQQRRGLRSGLAGLVAVTFGLSPVLFHVTFAFLSDALFALLGMLLALLWVGDRSQPGLRVWLLSGCLLGLMYLTRTAAVGISLPILALAVWCSVRHRTIWPALLLLLPIAAAASFWHLGVKPETPTYLEILWRAYQERSGWFEHGWIGHFRFAAVQLLDHLTGGPVLECLAPRWIAAFSPDLPVALLQTTLRLVGAAFMLAALAGILADRSRLGRVITLILGCYALQLALWPWVLGGRAVMVLVPFMIAWAFEGCNCLPAIFGRWLRTFLSAFVALNCLINAAASAEESDAMTALGELEDLYAIAAQAAAILPPQARIGVPFRLPVFQFHQRSGRQVCFSGYGADLESLVSVSDYLLLGGAPTAARALNPASETRGRVILRSPGGKYRLVKIDAEKGPPSAE